MARTKRFPWEQPACEKFDPAETVGSDEECSPALGEKIQRLGEEKRLTPVTFQQAVLEDAINRRDWKVIPVEPHVARLRDARTIQEGDEAIRSLGGLISLGNPQAFEALFSHLRQLPVPQTLDQVARRIRSSFRRWADRSAHEPPHPPAR